MKRTHTCGELKKDDINKKIILQGWIDSKREHGKITFINLRDRYGITQIVSEKTLRELKNESVISVKGKVRARPKEQVNKDMKTGSVEVLAEDIEVLNQAAVLPIDLSGTVESTEETRLRYRYLDLRKPYMQKNIILRHVAVKAARDFLDKQGFLEIETPMLAKSTPEGARDYIVPSRVNKGKFYALPQSPQLFKQLLMVSGFDKYFQIVRCFRDEDLRVDRQPEFTQIDIEMSFIDEEDIYYNMENMVKHMWKVALNKNIKIPFPRMEYADAMNNYGTDRPDTRFDLKLIDVSEIVKKSGFNVFKSAIESGGVVKCIAVDADFSRKQIDKLEKVAKIHGAKGLAWLKPGEEAGISKFLSDDEKKKLKSKAKGKIIFFVADHKHYTANIALGALRSELGKTLNLTDQKKDNFLWITDFPLVEYDEDRKRHVSVHHPFTMPREEDIKLLDKHPEKVKSKAYDLVLNGLELGGGSIRIHRQDLQQKIFATLGIDEKEAVDKFGFLLEAFKYGAPPHGGIAFGLDRVVAMMAGQESIREVIAFPKTKNAECLMLEAPSSVNSEQLNELGVNLK